jgi:hypothetical protein
MLHAEWVVDPRERAVVTTESFSRPCAWCYWPFHIACSLDHHHRLLVCRLAPDRRLTFLKRGQKAPRLPTWPLRAASPHPISHAQIGPCLFKRETHRRTFSFSLFSLLPFSRCHLVKSVCLLALSKHVYTQLTNIYASCVFSVDFGVYFRSKHLSNPSSRVLSTRGVGIVSLFLRARRDIFQWCADKKTHLTHLPIVSGVFNTHHSTFALQQSNLS